MDEEENRTRKLGRGAAGLAQVRDDKGLNQESGHGDGEEGSDQCSARHISLADS